MIIIWNFWKQTFNDYKWICYGNTYAIWSFAILTSKIQSFLFIYLCILKALTYRVRCHINFGVLLAHRYCFHLTTRRWLVWSRGGTQNLLLFFELFLPKTLKPSHWDCLRALKWENKTRLLRAGVTLRVCPFNQ